MRLDRLKAFALAQPQTTVVRQWGDCLVFKVVGKMFFLIALDGGEITGVIFKCTPKEFDDLVEIDGIGQAPYCAKRMWVRVSDLTVLPETELNARILRSFDLVVAKLPKKIQATLRLAAIPSVPAASSGETARASPLAEASSRERTQRSQKLIVMVRSRASP